MARAAQEPGAHSAPGCERRGDLWKPLGASVGVRLEVYGVALGGRPESGFVPPNGSGARIWTCCGVQIVILLVARRSHAGCAPLICRSLAWHVPLTCRLRDARAPLSRRSHAAHVPFAPRSRIILMPPARLLCADGVPHLTICSCAAHTCLSRAIHVPLTWRPGAACCTCRNAPGRTDDFEQEDGEHGTFPIGGSSPGPSTSA